MGIFQRIRSGGHNDRIIIFFAMLSTGLASLLYEVVLISVVTTVVGATELSLSIILSTFLMGLAIGALIGGMIVNRGVPLKPVLFFIEVLVALFGFFFLSFISLFVASGVSTNLVFWVIAAAMLIPTILMGMEIPIAVSILEQNEKRKLTGFVYFADTLGGVIGALFSGLIFIPTLGFHGAMYFGAFLNICTAILILGIGKDRLLKFFAVAGLLFFLPLVFFAQSQEFLQDLKLRFIDSFFSTGSYFHEIYYSEPIFSINSKYQHIMIMENPYDGRELYLNGKLQVTDKSSLHYHEFLTLPAIAAHPNPLRILVIGGGDGGVLYQLLKYNFSRIDHVDLDEEVLNISRKYLPLVHRGSLDDPRVHRYIQDGRIYLKKAANNSYDIIIIDLPSPDQLALAGLYSAEFYEEVSRVLDTNGIMTTQFPSPYYYLEAFASAYKTIRMAFPDTYPYVIPGGLYGSKGYIIAGKIDSRIIRSHDIEGVWYDEQTHEEMFMLTRYLRNYLENNTIRISSDKNPMIHLYMQNSYYFQGVADNPKEGR